MAEETVPSKQTAIESPFKKIEEEIEKQIALIKEIEEDVMTPWSLRKHKDYATLTRDAKNHIMGIQKLVTALKEKPDLKAGKKAKLCEKVYEETSQIDKDFLFTLFTTTSLLRSIALYYHNRIVLQKHFDVLASGIGAEAGGKDQAKLQKHVEEDEKFKEEMHHIATDLEKITRWTSGITAKGDLVLAIDYLHKILNAEGIKDESRFFVKKAVGTDKVDQLKGKTE